MSKHRKSTPVVHTRTTAIVIVVGVICALTIAGIAVSNTRIASGNDQAGQMLDSDHGLARLGKPLSPSIRPSLNRLHPETSTASSQIRVLNYGSENEFQDHEYGYSFRYPSNWTSNDFSAESPTPNLLRRISFKNPSEPDHTRGGLTLTIYPRHIAEQLAWLKEHGEGIMGEPHTLLISGQKAIELPVKGMQWVESEQKTVLAERTLVLIPLQDKTIILTFTLGSTLTSRNAYADTKTSIISSVSIR